MRQVVAIHGGDAFATYEESLEALKRREVSLDGPRGWKSTLGDALGEGYQVILPRMPNSFNAKYEEWKIWFEKYIPLLEDEVIFLGHSLGGGFLAKYLSIEAYPKKIVATLLVAAAFDEPEGSFGFTVSEPLDRFAEQGGKIYVYQSKDDPLVNSAEAEKYCHALPHAIVRIFEDRGHFLDDEFPEIVEDIKSLG